MGLGYHTVYFLACKGAKVYMGARSEQKALDAIHQLEADGVPKGSVEWLDLDLSDPRVAKKAAERFLEKEKRLDILVNNAGISSGPFTKDKDGLLNATVVNHISPFAFTKALLPLLQATSKEQGSDVRIINLTSAAHSEVSVSSLSDKESVNKDYGTSYSGLLKTYGHTKLLNILYIKEFQRQLDSGAQPGTPNNIICISVNPGMVQTHGSYTFLSQIPVFGWVLQLISPLMFTSPRKGALNSAWAAASPEVRLGSWKEGGEKYKGVYVLPVGVLDAPSESATSERLARELWDTTEGILKELGI
ncbi:hypothetical protein D9613_012425 [Agrocybe pediades]|uniref:NAD(P)-binding protein n=1 Tax=Agrocybe pediades TaxID=84607 RepID=A0A8H4QR94_9AGAR|nr:hypothetical protein D9613_012425 [Agrocybe pediades]